MIETATVESRTEMTPQPEESRILDGLRYRINGRAVPNLRLPKTTNPINFCAERQNGLSSNAWGVKVEKTGGHFHLLSGSYEGVEDQPPRVRNAVRRFSGRVGTQDDRQQSNMESVARTSTSRRLIFNAYLQVAVAELGIGTKSRDTGNQPQGLVQEPHNYRCAGSPDSNNCLLHHQRL